MPRGGQREGAGRKSGWAERGEKGGRKRLSDNEKTVYRTISVSLKENDCSKLKALAESCNLSVSQYIVQHLLNKEEV